MRPASFTFRAMGTDCTIEVGDTDGRHVPSEALWMTCDLIQRLEASWSRFRDDSDLTRVNATSSPVEVPRPLFDLIDLAMRAHQATGGIFDPRVIGVLEELGYGEPAVEEGGDWATLDLLTLHPDAGRYFVERGSGPRIDLGGIGKGRAADMAADLLFRMGVREFCVNLGGDLRVHGGPWEVLLESPDASRGWFISLDDGAVATSTSQKRTWSHKGRVVHHLIDPRVKRSSDSDLVQVSVFATEASWAEVYAKSALILGSDAGRELLRGAGLSAHGVTVDGETWVVDGGLRCSHVPQGHRS